MKPRPKILLVEDDPQVVTALTRVLGDEGYDVIHALDGTKGLSLATAEPCDLVITDFKLPGLSGMELLQNLHREGATICMVTHDPRFAKHAQREVHLFDGKVEFVE